MDPAAARYLTDLVTAGRGVLGDRLFGAYAAGSLGLDAYQPDRSDIDVALVVGVVCDALDAGVRGAALHDAGVVGAALDDGSKRALVAVLRHEALPCPARGLELVVYRRDVAASGAPEPGFEVELNTGAEMAFRATYHADDRTPADGRFWYALDRSILHQRGLALFGPPAVDVFADVTPTDLRALLVEALEWWLLHIVPDMPADDAVLGACRSLVKVRHGTWMSKVDAGRHLIATGYQPAAVIQRAIDARTRSTVPSTVSSAVPNSGPDTGLNAGTSTGPNAGTSTGPNAGAGTGPNAGTGTGPNAGTGTGTGPNASTGTGPNASTGTGHARGSPAPDFDAGRAFQQQVLAEIRSL